MKEWCDWSLSGTSDLVYSANRAHSSCPYVPIKTRQGRVPSYYKSTVLSLQAKDFQNCKTHWRCLQFLLWLFVRTPSRPSSATVDAVLYLWATVQAETYPRKHDPTAAW